METFAADLFQFGTTIAKANGVTTSVVVERDPIGPATFARCIATKDDAGGIDVRSQDDGYKMQHFDYGEWTGARCCAGDVVLYAFTPGGTR